MLHRPEAFYNAVRKGILGPVLTQSESDGCRDILAAFDGFPIADAAYALGTAFLETGGTMQPVKEANWLSAAAAHRYYMRMYDITGARPAKARELGNLTPGDGAKYPGMGYPQVTGLKNFALAKKVFGVDFVGKPELMMVAANAGRVMAHFMKHGLFTGKKLADYLPRSGPASLGQFTKSRPIINGTDRAPDVARAAFDFQTALIAGDWR